MDRQGRGVLLALLASAQSRVSCRYGAYCKRRTSTKIFASQAEAGGLPIIHCPGRRSCGSATAVQLSGELRDLILDVRDKFQRIDVTVAIAIALLQRIQ